MTVEDATFGRPSYWWRAGQERRFNMVLQHVDPTDMRVLDIGCGVGMYLKAFQRHTDKVFGIEVEGERAIKALDVTPNIILAVGETMPFADNSFDIVFLHEVIEHVDDDYLTIRDSYRIVAPGGHIVIFAPNRLYPFETHGIYWRGQYKFGNIPLVGYLPDFLRNKVAYHVRAYRARDIRKLFEGLNVEFVEFTQVYPGFDKLMTQHAGLSTLLRKMFYGLEKTPLKVIGLSHFVIAKVLC